MVKFTHIYLIRRTRLSEGFTVPELLIATAVFGLVIMVAMAGFFTVGQLFYKGQVNNQAQVTAKTISDTLAEDIKFAPSGSITAPVSYDSDLNHNYLCIGNVRYTFNVYKQIDLDNYDTSSKFGLLRDVLPASTACQKPFGAGSYPLTNPTELLTNRTRLNILCICNKPCNIDGQCLLPNSDIWHVAIKVSLGDAGAMGVTAETAFPTCDTNLSIARFCAVGEVRTSVSRAY